MSQDSDPPLLLRPAGYRFATITPDDHSGSIYIATLLCFTYSSITFITRCFIKWKMFGFDDWAVVVAQCTTVVQFILLLVSLAAGLGKTLDLLNEDDYLRMASSLFGNQVVLYLSLGLSKCAAVLLIQRLFTRDAKKFWLICNIGTGLMGVWTIFAVLTVSVGCSPKSITPIASQPECASLRGRYTAVAITDMLTDIILVMLPAYLVWQLQMNIRLKIQVLSAFAFRLPLLAFSILSLRYFISSLDSKNLGVDRTPAIAFQQSQLCFSLICATVPSLKAFIRSFDTGSGQKVGFTTGYGSSGQYPRGYGGGNSYRMQSLSGNGGAGGGSQLQSLNGENGDLKVNSKPFENGKAGHHVRGRAKSTVKVEVSSGKKDEDASITSHGSQEMIIRRDVKWEVKRENVS